MHAALHDKARMFHFYHGDRRFNPMSDSVLGTFATLYDWGPYSRTIVGVHPLVARTTEWISLKGVS